jgi:hypothetical protein
MNDDVATQGGLERIWKYSILPLLVEHFYGQQGVTDRFDLVQLQKAIRRAAAPDQVPQGEATPAVEESTIETNDSDDD